MDDRRKRLLWRASHRGIKEMDILLGNFAYKKLDSLNEADLNDFEELIMMQDHDLLDWIMGQEPPPNISNRILSDFLSQSFPAQL